MSLQNYVSCVDDCFIVSFYVIKLGGTVIKAGSLGSNDIGLFGNNSGIEPLSSIGNTTFLLRLEVCFKRIILA